MTNQVAKLHGLENLSETKDCELWKTKSIIHIIF